jgi:hypothetical protein
MRPRVCSSALFVPRILATITSYIDPDAILQWALCHSSVLEHVRRRRKGAPLCTNITHYMNNVSILCWAMDMGYEVTTNTAEIAAEQGHLEVLRWMHAQGVILNGEVSMRAASGGHIPVLEFLRSVDCPIGLQCSASAAERGRYDVLLWLKAHGVPWDTWTTAAAARGGRVSL